MTVRNANSCRQRHIGQLTGLFIAWQGLALSGCDLGDTSDDDAQSGGQASVGGSTATGGRTASPVSGAPSYAGGDFGSPTQMGEGSTSNRWEKTDVARDGVYYYFMANGWGPNFRSQLVEWKGTSFTVQSAEGSPGSGYEPATYPTVFCGVYSDSTSKECGLPRALNQLTSVRTGWRWKPNGNTGQYNAAYDIWLSNDATRAGLSSYLMVWLRDPPGQRPAGSVRHRDITLPGVPGRWDIWVGNVSGASVASAPYVAYALPEGQDIYQIEFDVMTFVRDAAERSLPLPGTHMLSVAVGFEIWLGPISNLVSEDFYVRVQ